MKEAYYPEVYNLLGKGHKNAVPLKTLMAFTGTSGSNIRLMIEKMVESGIPIVNLEDGKGYFIPETPEEVHIARRKKYSRAKKLLKSCYHLKKAETNLLYTSEGLIEIQ